MKSYLGAAFAILMPPFDVMGVTMISIAKDVLSELFCTNFHVVLINLTPF